MSDPGRLEVRTPQVVSLVKKSSDKQRALLAEMNAHYVAEFAPHADTTDNPEGVAFGIHKKIDRHIRILMKDARARRVSCKKGCAHCCNVPVRITREEAILIRHVLHEQGRTIDEGRLERQTAIGDKVEDWGTLPDADKRCVFLANGACTIYEHRPAACRKYFVVSDPKFCDVIKNNGARVEILSSNEAEIIYNAALEVFDSDVMGAALLKVRLDVR